MNSTDDIYRRLIKPIRDDYISEIISGIDNSLVIPYDKHLNWAERMVPIKYLREQFTKWSETWISGLEKFPYLYIMNGNTDYLNSLFRSRPVAWKNGDYSYYQHWHSSTRTPGVGLTEPASVKDIVISWPGYSKGDSTELDFAKSCDAERIHIDCAYLGLTSPQHLDASIAETVSISFSKTLSIPYNRIALLFSKTEIAELSTLNKLGYVNLSGVKLVSEILKKFDINHWWKTYGGDRLQKLCDEHQLTATNCILFGYQGSNRINLAEYWYK